MTTRLPQAIPLHSRLVAFPRAAFPAAAARSRPCPVAAIVGVMLAAAISSPTMALCPQWDLSGQWRIRQANGYTVDFDLTQSPDGNIRGSGRFVEKGEGRSFDALFRGPVQGTMTGEHFTFVVSWADYKHGEYKGRVNADGTFAGTTLDLKSPSNATTWSLASNRRAVCIAAATPPSSAPPRQPHPPAQGPVKRIGKVSMGTAINDVDIYNGPGGEYRVIGMMRAGTSGRVLDRREGWHKLSLSVPGGTGWVASDHLTVGMR
jgi:hypothetical protein